MRAPAFIPLLKAPVWHRAAAARWRLRLTCPPPPRCCPPLPDVPPQDKKTVKVNVSHAVPETWCVVLGARGERRAAGCALAARWVRTA